MGWVIVEFPETREVFVDDKPEGGNRGADGQYLVLIVEDGLHTFRLGGTGVNPATQDVTVADTSALDPLRVVFKRAA
jgi:hypothetical protein